MSKINTEEPTIETRLATETQKKQAWKFKVFHKKLKKKNIFFAALEEQARIALDAVRAVMIYCDDPTEENGDRVKELENDGDEVRKELINTINKTFITPIDREDLFQLSLDIDDITDYMLTTITDMEIYGIKPDSYVRKMILELEEMTAYLYEAVKLLEFSREEANHPALRAKKLENIVNTSYHNALANLYESDDIKKILKYREIYNHLNNASDRGDEAANSIMNISVKL